MDLSQKVIRTKILPKAEEGKIKTIVIPDLVQLLGHKKTTVKSTLGFLQALTEEGVMNIDFYGNEYHGDKPVFASLLTAITPQEFKNKAYEWTKNGFLSRLIPITFDYSEDKIDSIQNSIVKGELTKEVNKINKSRKTRKKIKIPENLGYDIRRISTRVKERLRGFYINTYKGSKSRNKRKFYIFKNLKGIRIHKRLRQLVRAICYLDSKGKRDTVNSKDIIKLEKISNTINLTNTKYDI